MTQNIDTGRTATANSHSEQPQLRGDSFARRVLAVLSRKYSRVRSGRDSFTDLALFFTDQATRVIFNRNPQFYGKRKAHQFSSLKHEDGYHIKDARLPLLDPENECLFFGYVFEDTFYSYLYLDDDYSEKTVDECDKFLYEGLYGLVNDSVDVRVKPGDVVIDAGSWAGDFAAYSSAKGAGKVYAFEPTEANFKYLVKTAELNPGIIPVKLGLSNETTSRTIFLDERNTGASSMLEDMCVARHEETEIHTTTVDQFVSENHIERVDFIKSDIEGFERYMLEGAQETLRRFAPKLALCTYHLPDDPQVMAGLILKANPRYSIIQKSKKLYASVPGH